MKAFSAACERNREPILQQLQGYCRQPGRLLELGSGTGQHALYFSQALPHISWTPSDLDINQQHIKDWSEAGPENLLQPLIISVTDAIWFGPWDHIFTANTAHIISWSKVQDLLAGAARELAGGHLFLYGPFKYEGKYTSASNAEFDAWLKQRDPESGIRDFEAVVDYALSNGLRLVADHSMPSNNQMLVFSKV